MDAKQNFSWVDFYTEFATKLLDYRGNRGLLIEKIQEGYKNIGIELPTLEQDGNLVDIDPFTVFALFNRGITDKNRIAIIQEFSTQFSVSAPLPTHFRGIPVVNNLKTAFYGFLPGRREHDIDNLWTLFSVALALADNESLENRDAFIAAYNLAIQQQQVKWNITMGLFWVRPYRFINLDSRNRWYLSSSDYMPEPIAQQMKQFLRQLPSGEDYLTIGDTIQATVQEGKEPDAIAQLSHRAWIISKEVNEEKRIYEEARDLYNMDANLNFSWIPFYTEFARKLLEYKENRDLLIEKIQQGYKNIGVELPTLEQDGNWVDIDPFTVFALFTRGITDENRIAIIQELSARFSVAAPLPTGFDGLAPVINTQSVFFLDKEKRGGSDIQNLWDVFESAFLLLRDDTQANRDAFTSLYRTVMAQGWVKRRLSLGLSWINPHFFLPVTYYTAHYLRTSEEVSVADKERFDQLEKSLSANSYLEYRDFCEELIASSRLRFKNFMELTFYSSLFFKRREKRKKQSTTLGDSKKDTIRYWLYTPSKWQECSGQGIMDIKDRGLGNLLEYASKEEIAKKIQELLRDDSSHKNHVLAAWQFAREIQPGDIILVKRGSKPGNTTILGRGVVTSEYRYDEIYDSTYAHIRDVDWTHKGEWPFLERLSPKELTEITSYPGQIQEIKDLLVGDMEDPDTLEVTEERDSSSIPYTPEEFLEEVYINSEQYTKIVEVLKRKKNIILQGAPGVGKTFAAKRLAYSIMGKKDKSRATLIQFHQSYSYEDFIMGYRPTESGGFSKKPGPFYEFCNRAADDNEHDYFFIIDEINRGNLSKIFGELFMLIEEDKRGERLQLLYSGERFTVPENVYIIGMMNTADRSLALLDYALRRRFAFIDLRPAFMSDGFKEYQNNLRSKLFDTLMGCIFQLNQAIQNDDSLGDGFVIGHSYFCNLDPESLSSQELSHIIEYEIIPLIKEYWFDNPLKVSEWSDTLRGALK